MNRSILLVLPLVLGGCPFVFGPPDLVGTTPTGSPIDTDTDTDADTDTDTDTDTDSGTLPTTGTTTGTPGGTITTPDPPQIATVTTSFGYGKARLVVEIDATTQLDGGVIELDDGNVPIALSIPVDLAAWDAVNNVATIEVDTGTPCGGLSLAWTLSVTDFGGTQGPTANAQLDVASYTHDENNDPTDFGSMTVPAIVCGDLSPGSELDWFQFSGVGGTWFVSLHDLSGSPKDRDILLQDTAGIVTFAAATTSYDPDTFVYAFTGVLGYQIEIDNPAGGGGSEWQVIFHEW